MLERVEYIKDESLAPKPPKVRNEKDTPERREATEFYGSVRWQRVRKHYKATHPLCERCLAEGEYNPTTIVHHRVDRLTCDTSLWYDYANLEGICYDHHNKHHGRARRKGNNG